MLHLVLMTQSGADCGDMAPSIRILASSTSKEKLIEKRNNYIRNLWVKNGFDKDYFDSVDDYLDSDYVFVKQNTEQIIDINPNDDENFHTLAICEDKVID